MTAQNVFAPAKLFPWHATYRPGFAAKTKILTPAGPVIAECLRPGDKVTTRRGVKSLSEVRLACQPSDQQCVLVGRNAFDGQLDEELILLPDQRVVLRDWRARAMFRQDIAAPSIYRLIDRETIRFCSAPPTNMVALMFGQPEVIYSGGLEVASADPPLSN